MRSLVSTPVFEKAGTFDQVDYDNGIAYGFAIVCTQDDKPYWDLQDDHIPEDEMTKAAIEFFSGARAGKDQHAGDDVADVVFGMPMTKSIQSAEGITCRKTGLWIGYKPQDPVQLDMIASGERTGFSIGGVLLDSYTEEIGKAVWSQAYQDKLPDSSFLYVKPGGTKDKDGKTTPRSNRMFPVKGSDGKVDAAHVTNALSRVANAKIPDGDKDRVRSAAQKLQGDKTEKSYAGGGDDTGGTPPKKKGRVFRTFKIREISLVDRPAQEGAVVSTVKRRVIARRDITKDVSLTSVDAGHQHTLYLDELSDDYAACTSYATSTGEVATDGGHTHRVVLVDGKPVITANAGHTHTVTVPDDWAPPVRDADDAPNQPGVEIIASAPVQTAPNNLTSAAKSASVTSMTDAEIALLNARLAKAEKLASMSDAQKSYFYRLGSDAQSVMIGKSLVDIGAEVTSAVIWKNERTGREFYRGDESLVELAKENEALRKSQETEVELRKDAEFSKAALELKALPGDAPTHVALVKAVASIKDDKVRQAVTDTLKGAAIAADMLTRATGHQHEGDPVVKSAEATLYTKRDEWATKAGLPLATDIDKAKATRAFLQTAEGASLKKACDDAALMAQRNTRNGVSG